MIDANVRHHDTIPQPARPLVFLLLGPLLPLLTRQNGRACTFRTGKCDVHRRAENLNEYRISRIMTHDVTQCSRYL